MILSWLLLACSTVPVFEDVSSITLVRQDQSGTKRTKIEGHRFADWQSCLYNSTEVSQEEVSDKYLAQMLMIQVEDKGGKRMFEMFTMENMKGNNGKYYQNKCAYGLIKGL